MLSRISANKAFYILFGFFALGVYILFSLINKIAPLTVSHTIYYCQKVLSNILFTLPHSTPSILMMVLASIILIGLFLLLIQLLKTYLFIRKTIKNKIAIPSKVNRIVLELEIVDKIDIVKNRLLLSFCYGLIKPRICLSLNLVRTLSEKELKAVLIHESYHLKSKDPLKILLSQIATSMFFFVPTLKDIHSYYTLSKEVAADQLATESKSINDLKSALTKVLRSPTPVLSRVASFANDNLEQRINVLTKTKKLSLKISFLRLIMSFSIFVLALVALNMPVYAIENNHDDSHSYFICPYSGECMLSCTEQGVMSEMPFGKDRIFTPANYSPNN